MFLNDLNNKVNGKFIKEVIIEDDGREDIIYVFPDTKEFISILKRKLIKKKLMGKESSEI